MNKTLSTPGVRACKCIFLKYYSLVTQLQILNSLGRITIQFTNGYPFFPGKIRKSHREITLSGP